MRGRAVRPFRLADLITSIGSYCGAGDGGGIGGGDADAGDSGSPESWIVAVVCSDLR